MGHPVAEVGAVLVPPVAINAPHAPHPRMRNALPVFCPNHLINGPMEGGKDRDSQFVVFVEKAGDDRHHRLRQLTTCAGAGEAIEDHFGPHDPSPGVAIVLPPHSSQLV